MYMSKVGVAELRQNLSTYLKQVADGEEFVVTDHNIPVAQLVPLGEAHVHMQVSPARRRTLPEPIRQEGGSYSISEALRDVRDESR